MTLPIKPPPGYCQYQFFNPHTGKSPRLFSLPRGIALRINNHLKDLGVPFRLCLAKPELEALDERSD